MQMYAENRKRQNIKNKFPLSSTKDNPLQLQSHAYTELTENDPIARRSLPKLIIHLHLQIDRRNSPAATCGRMHDKILLPPKNTTKKIPLQGEKLFSSYTPHKVHSLAWLKTLCKALSALNA
ncbi:hypothetical protein GCWU000325_00921 [Alloprevotella tannerae ATCC 51259]|uniref:Uncharacterized protein n=1 Tax=Alloprevotella tannerae ATCC 51259 TaxID=626522 RepID=C9LFE0_9BACT|nr:hypothetical protein GCWU000325_00921 [Alloprevotella tannerae ATCC 51259]